MLSIFVIGTGIAATAILTAALAGRIAEARLAEHGLTRDRDDDVDDLSARVQSLKDRYQHDERHDDMLVRRAAYAVGAWRDGTSVDRAMRELQASLECHPEFKEQRDGAT